MPKATAPDRIDWHSLALERAAQLAEMATQNEVSFTAREAALLVAMTIRLDAEAAMRYARALAAGQPWRGR